MSTMIFLGGLGAGSFLSAMLFLSIMILMAGNRKDAKATEAKYESLMKQRNETADMQISVLKEISENIGRATK